MVATGAPRPMRVVQRARLWAMTCMVSQAPFGGKASRGEMVEPHAVLQVADGVLDLGVVAMVGLQIQGVTLAVGDAAVIAVGGEPGPLGATLCPHPGRAEVTNWLVRPKDVC